MKLGIIGYGRFGNLIAHIFNQLFEILVFDLKPICLCLNKDKNIKVASSYEEITQVDILFMCVPISAFKTTCLSISPTINRNTLIVDTCSIKIYPAKIMNTIFGESQDMLLTHPLFGPNTVEKNNGLDNLRIVICEQQEKKNKSAKQMMLEDIFDELKLIKIYQTIDEHDKTMAATQGLLHFIGRGTENSHIDCIDASTHSFKYLNELVSLVKSNSMELFLDMHAYNPYSSEIRKLFIESLLKIDKEILARKIS